MVTAWLQGKAEIIIISLKTWYFEVVLIFATSIIKIFFAMHIKYLDVFSRPRFFSPKTFLVNDYWKFNIIKNIIYNIHACIV